MSYFYVLYDSDRAVINAFDTEEEAVIEKQLHHPEAQIEEYPRRKRQTLAESFSEDDPTPDRNDNTPITPLSVQDIINGKMPSIKGIVPMSEAFGSDNLERARNRTCGEAAAEVIDRWAPEYVQWRRDFNSVREDPDPQG